MMRREIITKPPAVHQVTISWSMGVKKWFLSEVRAISMAERGIYHIANFFQLWKTSALKIKRSSEVNSKA